LSPDQTSDVYYEGLKQTSSNPLNDLVQGVSTGQNASFSNFQGGTPTNSSLNSNPAGFGEFSYEAFQGTVSTNQGTQQFYGVLGVFWNSSSGYEVFFVYEATSQSSVQSNLNSLNTMNDSVVAS